MELGAMLDCEDRGPDGDPEVGGVVGRFDDVLGGDILAPRRDDKEIAFNSDLKV